MRCELALLTVCLSEANGVQFGVGSGDECDLIDHRESQIAPPLCAEDHRD
jgi:hypothetical protein